jgi:hypothetical protein
MAASRDSIRQSVNVIRLDQFRGLQSTKMVTAKDSLFQSEHDRIWCSQDKGCSSRQLFSIKDIQPADQARAKESIHK